MPCAATPKRQVGGVQAQETRNRVQQVSGYETSERSNLFWARCWVAKRLTTRRYHLTAFRVQAWHGFRRRGSYLPFIGGESDKHVYIHVVLVMTRMIVSYGRSRVGSHSLSILVLVMCRQEMFLVSNRPLLSFTGDSISKGRCVAGDGVSFSQRGTLSTRARRRRG